MVTDQTLEECMDQLGHFAGKNLFCNEVIIDSFYTSCTWFYNIFDYQFSKCFYKDKGSKTS